MIWKAYVAAIPLTLCMVLCIIAIPSPLENIDWLISYQQQDKHYTIVFTWSRNTHHPPNNCDHPTYNILASNCGKCPTTTNHTTATCTEVPIDSRRCTFTVQSVVNVCGGVTGELSNHVSVGIFNHNGNNTVLSACLYDRVMISSLYFCFTKMAQDSAQHWLQQFYLVWLWLFA